jgi:hypothetical protein
VYLRTAFRNVPDGDAARAGALRGCRTQPWWRVQSDSPQVHSENEVVYLLSAWVKAQETATPLQRAEQLEQPGHVRLVDCGPAYLLMSSAGLVQERP